MKAWGADGCRSGWFYFGIEGSSYAYGTASTLAILLDRVPARGRLFVDMPIGLARAGEPERGCDAQARAVLGERRSSVFTAPVREVLDATDAGDANRRSKRLTGKGLARQSFNSMPKIVEVDRLMRASARARRTVREVHPELCFWSFAGGTPMRFAKKTREGREERLALLSALWPPARVAVARAYFDYGGAEVGRDDVIDALVVALTAHAPRSGLRTLPPRPRRDSEGLRMAMVYALPEALADLS